MSLQVEKATMTAAVMSTPGGLSKECDKLVRQIAMKLSLKRGERYSDVVGFNFIRRRLRFDLLRTCVIALRGFKKNAALISNLLITFEINCFARLRGGMNIFEL